ncbi:MAG TPA: short-chain fatty acyl-CoA regulator family protein [Candidatus Limnocylindria bacterium]|nr:short-chain fatty acyl-CoA regulator family protein [Candidatus Limnocylindria bacterium]
MTDRATQLGKKIRALRASEGLTQSALAERLSISPSYLNLIEHDRRPLSADLLLRLARIFDLDLKVFAGGEDAKLVANLMEVFGDPLFAGQIVGERELRETVAGTPELARAIVLLHHAYMGARGSAEALAEQALDRQDLAGLDLPGLSSEQVSDLLQRHSNHFPELEAEAEKVWKDGALERENLFGTLCRYLEATHRVQVRILEVGQMRGAVRRYHPERRELMISEVLRRGSRNFQLAHLIGLLNGSEALDQIARDPQLTSVESRALCRVALANYFASAVLMPYDEFFRAAEDERYDLELLGDRFRSSFEQVCHRVTTLHRRGAKGVPFDMVRIDIAGNISKKLSVSGIHFPRFGGLCPLWNVHAAFLQPGMIRVQPSRLPDGATLFSIARTVRKHRGGYHSADVLYAIGLNCDLDSARRLVYAEGMDLANPAAAMPVGITCRLCERMDCRARAFPSLRRPLQIDENVRGVSFYAPVSEE